jgi:hypothetical protein
MLNNTLDRIGPMSKTTEYLYLQQSFALVTLNTRVCFEQVEPWEQKVCLYVILVSMFVFGVASIFYILQEFHYLNETLY